MKLKTMYYAVAAILAICWVQTASAWPDFAWTGAGGDGMWNNPLNWNNLDETTNTTGLPDSGTGATQIDPQAGSTQVTIPAGYVVDLGYETPGAPVYNTLFGGEWGMTLNIHGTLEYNWMWAPVQNYWPNGRTIINLYTNSVVQTQGAGVGIGYAWWWYAGAPYVTMNMYGNATLIEPNIALGGHLNIYDTAVAYVGIDVFTGNPLMDSKPGLESGNPGQGGSGMSAVLGTGNQGTHDCSDLTASLNLGGGTIVLPFTYTNETAEPGNTIYDLIARGVLRVYGKGFDTNDLIITFNATNTFATNIISTNVIVVTAAPLGGSLSQIYFEPLLQSPAKVGTIQQARLVGDYPSVSGVLLSSPEPGLDPAVIGTPVYTSSNPNVFTVDANGIVTAVGAGSATLTATLGSFTSPPLTVTVGPVTATLIHRYSFSETSGSTAHDSMGSADGTLNGTAAFSGTGQVVLDGTVGSSVSLPSGILSNIDEVSIEVWATFPGTINNYAALFAFGNTDLTPFDPNYGAGYDYISCQPHTGVGTLAAHFGQGVPGNNGEFPNDVVMNGVLDNTTNVQVVAVWHPLAGTDALYTNGVPVASGILFNDMVDPVAYQHNGSVVNYQLHGGPTNYIGQSLYPADLGLLANIDEFRIYNGPLTAAQVAADNALGPNQLRGTSTSVSLSAALSGGNVVISWPTTSALVNLVSSPTLGSGAVWTPMNMSSLVVAGGNYHITVPTTGTRFFRLQQ
jgi:Bacterial Ig-like domain (group 2)